MWVRRQGSEGAGSTSGVLRASKRMRTICRQLYQSWVIWRWSVPVISMALRTPRSLRAVAVRVT